MNIGILALDSIYSNPALMKISNYHQYFVKFHAASAANPNISFTIS